MQAMGRLDRILAIIDPTSDVQPALDKARFLAQRAGGTLELFVCDFDPSMSGKPLFDTGQLRELRADFVSERMEFLESLADDIRAGGISVETHVHWDNPIHRGILRRVRESSPDLVVKDTHHHSAIRRTLLSNTDWNLIRSCPVPLLLAKPGEWKARPRILAAVDPEHVGDPAAALDQQVLANAKLMADLLGGEVHVVHAFLPETLLAAVMGPGALPFAAGVSASEVVGRERERLAEVLAALTSGFGLTPGQIHLEQGRASEVLQVVARNLSVDVLVMGAVSRSRLQELFVGGTAEFVLDRLPCDVLVVKPSDLHAV